VTRLVAGQTLIVPVRSSVADLDSVYAFNEVCTSIWNAVDGATSQSEIVDAICAEYDVPRPEAEKDVAEFLGRLLELGLIRRSDDGES